MRVCTPIAVRYGETDMMGVVYHANYLLYFEDARTAFLEAIGYPYRLIEEAGLMSPVLHFACDYGEPLRYGDAAVVRTRLVLARPTKATYAYEVFREGMDFDADKPLAQGRSTHCLVEKDTFKPVSMKKATPDSTPATSKSWNRRREAPAADVRGRRNAPTPAASRACFAPISSVSAPGLRKGSAAQRGSNSPAEAPPAWPGSQVGASPVMPAMCPMTPSGVLNRASRASRAASWSRLERRRSRSATTSGTCAYTGCGSPSRSCRCICCGVEHRRSTPRTTKFTPCAASSTTTASW